MDAHLAGPLAIDTPLGDAVTFDSMKGSEGLSMLFAYELDVLSPRADLDASDLLGHPVTVHLERGDVEQRIRHWSGRVTGFEYIGSGDDGRSRYRLIVHPWLWYLTQSADCRIFQRMSVPDIITKVFRDRGFTDFDNALSGTYAPQEYVVQYRETDFDFVSRLMQRAGIYYFFRHVDGRHTLVLADDMGAHDPAAGCEQLGYRPPDPHREAMGEYVRRWRAMAEVATSRYTHADYDFTRPRSLLRAISSTPDLGGAPDLEVYDYPGGFTSSAGGVATSAVRLGQRRSTVQEWAGESNARGLTVGCTLKLVDHPREDQNRKYLVTAARYALRAPDLRAARGTEQQKQPQQEVFSSEFRVIRTDETFRAPACAPKPLMFGPQTAIVVGPAGQEIWTDQFGRVKVQFHWDREGKHNENSSCFVRVLQAWAGTGWGAQFIPRIGQEVIVDFIEGDPDRPIITGSVYNGANDAPFKLPNNQTQSGIRTRSTPGGSQVNSNEIRFEDAKGNEELYVQAEKNQTTLVKDSQSESVGRNRSVSVGMADALTVGSTRSIQVGLASVTTIGGASSEAVGGMRTVTVGGQNIAAIGLGSVTEVGGDMLTKVGGVTRFDLAGPLRLSTSADESRTTGGKLEVRVGEDASYVYAAEAKTVIGHPDREARLSTFVYGTSTSTTSKELVLESDTSIVLKCGDTKVVVTPDGVTINGKTLAWNAGTKLSVASPHASLTLDDDFRAIGKESTLSSSGAKLTLDSGAKLIGAKVQLGAGSGANASSSAQNQKDSKEKKPVYIRTKIVRNGKPAAGVAYTLVLDGVTQLSGSTTGAGLVEQEVPPTVASAVLTLLDTGEIRTLTISPFEPVTTVLGAQVRLKRLGFYHGALDGTGGPLTQHAIVVFQQVHGLAKSGQLDAATQAALKSAYGS